MTGPIDVIRCELTKYRGLAAFLALKYINMGFPMYVTLTNIPRDNLSPVKGLRVGYSNSGVAIASHFVRIEIGKFDRITIEIEISRDRNADSIGDSDRSKVSRHHGFCCLCEGDNPPINTPPRPKFGF